MALQSTGVISYSDIESEFGRSDATGAPGWSTIYDAFSAPSGNFVTLPKTYVQIYNEYSVFPVNRVRLSGGTYTFTYNTSVVGSNTDGSAITSGDFRYNVGDLVTDTGSSQIYKIRVEELQADENNGTYEYTYLFANVGTSAAPTQSITVGSGIGAFKYTRGSLVLSLTNYNRYAIKVETYGTTAGSNYSLGNYRMDNASEFGGMIVPLDTDCGESSNLDMPTGTSPISFSNFYNARLNIAVDYFTANENRPDDAVTKFGDPAKRKVVGGFKVFPGSTSPHKVAIIVNKIISGKSAGANGASVNECSLRTGSSWSGGTKVSVQVGSSGRIYGAGGDGGAGGNVDGFNRDPSDGSAGENGTSALGVQYNNTAVKVRTGGKIVSGFGGGGGGGGAFEDSTPGEEYRPRCGSGGGGGGGVGSPAGVGGATGSITTPDPNEHASPGNAGSAGSVPNGGEQSGAGGTGGNNINEAIGGTGGRGRDEETTGTGFDNDGTGQVSQGRTSSGSYVGSVGGAKGTDGAAIRRTGGLTVTITNDGTIGGETAATGVS